LWEIIGGCARDRQSFQVDVKEKGEIFLPKLTDPNAQEQWVKIFHYPRQPKSQGSYARGFVAFSMNKK